MDVTDIDKHSSLLQYRMKYGRKDFILQALGINLKHTIPVSDAKAK